MAASFNLIAVALTTLALIGATPSAYQDCTRFFSNDACDQTRVAWLPSYGWSAQWWQRGQATQITKRDGFVYERKDRDPRRLGFQGPDDGTFFVYAGAGPTKGHVVYDHAHRIAFYDQSCCSWHNVIAAAGVRPLPSKVVERDLSHLITVRGLHLGDSMTAVTRMYGHARPLPIVGHPAVVLLAYTTWPPYNSQRAMPGPCGQFENLVFRKNRLVYIQFGNGC